MAVLMNNSSMTNKKEFYAILKGGKIPRIESFDYFNYIDNFKKLIIL